MKNIYWIILPFLILSSNCSVQEVQKLSFTKKVFIRSYNDCDTANTSCTKFYAEYPVIKYAADTGIERMINSKISEFLINSSVYDTAFSSLEDRANQFFNQYSSLKSDFVDYNIPWEIICKISVEYLSDSVITFKEYNFNFIGGAHPNTVLNYKSYNLKSGKLISLNGIIEKTKKVAFNQYAETVFRETKNIPADSSLQKLGFWFENEIFRLPENIGIIKDGIIMYYNPYEIAPYSFGPTILNIRKDDLDQFLKKGKTDLWK